MVEYVQLLSLGLIAGLTIFLGLPFAVLQGLSSRKKGFLNAFALGILIFLTIDVFGSAWQSVSNIATDASVGKASLVEASIALFAMFGGLAIGLLGLTWYARRYLRVGSRNESAGAGFQRSDGHHVAMMIAVGIGAHNFSEGLAIGQSYASGAVGLALILIIGFAAHNATEGFGIASPLAGVAGQPSYRFLMLLGLVGGGPTFLGTVLGSLWSSTFTYILFLTFAGGALIYVTLLMFNSGRRLVSNEVLMVGIFLGLVAGFGTDLLITLGGA